jgi:hypothetical protein
MSGRVARTLRWAVFAGVVVVALASAGTWWLVRSDAGQSWLRAQVGAALGPSVRFDAVRVGLWPPPLAVALHDVEVLGADGAPIVRARRLYGRVRLRALLEGPPLLVSVEVEEFEVTVIRADDGSIGFAAHGGQAAPATLPAALDAQCPTITLHDGRITLRDAGNDAAPPVQIEDVAADLTPTRPGARLSLQGRSAQIGTVDADIALDNLTAVATAPFNIQLHAREASAAVIGSWMPQAGDGVRMAGRAQVDATLSGRPGAGEVDATITLHSGEMAWRDTVEATAPITLGLHGTWGTGTLATASGDVAIARLEADGVIGTDVHATFSATPQAVTLRDLRWQALGGAWRQAGSVLLAHGAVLDGEVVAEHVDGGALAMLLGERFGTAVAPLHLDGPLRLRAALNGTIGATLDGSLAVELEHGSAAWDTARALAPLALTADLVLTGSEPTVSNGRLRAASLTDRDVTATAVEASFGLAGQVLRVDTLQARAFDGDWTASGSVPLDGSPPTVSLSAVGVNAAHLARAVLTGQQEEAGTAGDVDLTVELRGGRGTINLRLASPTLTLADIQVSRPATASGTVTWAGKTARVSNGRAQLSRVRVDTTDIGNVQTSFSTTGTGQLRLAPLSARAFGGTWTIDATLSRQAIDGTVRAVAVDLDPMLAALDAGPRSTRASATVEATVHRPREGATNAALTVQLLRGRFLFDDLTVDGPARGTATLRVDGERWSVTDGIVSAANARYAFLQGSNATARLDFDPDHIRFADLRFTAANAPWQCTGTVTLDAPPRIDGSVNVVRADPETLATMLSLSAPTLDPDGLDLNLRARATLDQAWERNLQGSGTMALRGGTLASTALLRAVVATVVPTRRLRDGGPPNHLTSLTQTFTLSDGQVRTSDLQVRSDDYAMTAAGTIGLDGQLALQGQVDLTPNGIQKMFALSSLPIPGASILSLPTIPARIDGTLADPHVHPEAAALAGSTARWFGEALLGTPRRLGQAVTMPFEALFNGLRRATPTPAR